MPISPVSSPLAMTATPARAHGPMPVRRFAFVSTMSGLAWGGSEELWSQTASRLQRNGHAVSASVVRWPNDPARLGELAADGVVLRRRPMKRAWLDRILQKRRKEAFPGSPGAYELAWLKKQAVDLIVFSQGGPWDGVGWMLACRKLGIPYCCVIHAHSELWWPQDAYIDVIRDAFSGAVRVFFVSEANRTLMRRQCGLPFAQSDIVANPLKLDAREAVAWPAGDTEFNFACVGRLDAAAKGQDILLDVLSRPKWRKRPVRLNLYGSGGSEKSLKALASTLALSNVSFRGHVSDVSAIWSANHALLLPSRYEGLPLVILEAMLAGRPVVTTDVAGNTEYIRDGETGFVASAPTASLFDDAMERAWSFREDWREMGLKARADAILAFPADPVGIFSEKLLAIAAKTANA